MGRTKTYTETAKAGSVVTPKSTGKQSGTLLLQRAADAPGAARIVKPQPVTGVTVRTNLRDENVAAVVVKTGANLQSGQLQIVGPGDGLTAPSGHMVAAFLHADGTAVEFHAAGPGLLLNAAQATATFGGLLQRARKLLGGGASAAPKTMQRRAESAGPVQADASVTEALRSSSAQSLPTRSRTHLEASYGADLSGVRIHTDAAADRATRAVQAKAVTTGQDIYFRSGQFQPESTTGSHLLAHEVAHTIQQGSHGSGLARKAESAEFEISRPGDALELEADRAADAAQRGTPVTLGQKQPPTTTPAFARREELAATATSPAPIGSMTAAPAAPPVAQDAAPAMVKVPPVSAIETPHAATATTAAGNAQAPAAVPLAPMEPLTEQPAAEAVAVQTDATQVVPVEATAAASSDASGHGEIQKQETAPAKRSSGGLQAVTSAVGGAARAEKSHEPVGTAVAATQQSVDVTPEEAAGRAQGSQVQAMAGQKKSPFNKAKFKEALRAQIAKLKADQAKDVKENDQAQEINNTVKSGVAGERQAAAGAIDQAAKQPPPPGQEKPGAALPAPQVGAAPAVDGSRAVPGTLPPEAHSMATETAAMDDQMAAAKVTPEQLQKSNEPAFQSAAETHATAKSEAAALPEKSQAAEASTLETAKGNAANTTTAGLGSMRGQRTEKLAGSKEEQDAGKKQTEERRKEISNQLTAIYTETKTSVDNRLAKMDEDVNKAFEDGASSAKWDFYGYITVELLKYYVGGGWVANLFSEGDDKEKIFTRAKDVYLQSMDRTIDRVAEIVETALNEVVTIIDAGRVRLEATLSKFGPEDAAVAQEVAGGLREQFASLEKSVEDKQADVINSLAEKFVAAEKEVDSVIESLRNPVGALISLALESIAGVIQTILQMKALFMSALAKAGEAIDLILSDPIAFLSNLVAGVKQGVQNFLGNILTHLQKGLMTWLFGTLTQAGIQMPDKFDLSGLMSIVLQVLGLTWTNIRKRAVAIVGEPVIAAIEKASEIFVVLATKGISGLWEYIKEQAAAIMEQAKGMVISFLVESVIGAGIKWLIGLLNPASAFVKACMAIYDIIMFIINRGTQILTFVNAVLDSVLSIAKGDVAPAAQKVEAALAQSIPVAIGFLASLLGLGDLSEKIKKVIEKIQAPVNKAIDWVIKKAVAIVKSVGKALGIGKKDEKRSQPEASKLVNVAEQRVSPLVSSFDSAEDATITELDKVADELGLTSIEVVEEFTEESDEPTYHFVVTINPKKATRKSRGKKRPRNQPKRGETTATKVGKRVHKRRADNRRRSGKFEDVNTPITDKRGNPILVPHSVDLESGNPSSAKRQVAVPDAVSYKLEMILDDKPAGRPLSKDRQELIRFITAYRIREGKLPKRIVIVRYDPKTGQPAGVERYSPSDLLPGR